MGTVVRIGIDTGGTKTDAVAVDASGRVVERVRLGTGFGVDAVVETIRSASAELGALLGTPLTAVESIGVGIPGVVDPAEGRVRHAVNLGLGDVPLGELLRSAIGVPVRVENDVKAAALGAYHLLGLGGSMGYLNLGTGLAAGLVIDGRLWRGARGTAGEIGHIPVDPHGDECPCGQRGCLETVASGSGIARMWPSQHAVPAVDLFDQADAGDARAIAVRTRFVDGVASAVRLLVLTGDLEAVVIGGGLSNLGDRLLDAVRATLTEWGATSEFLASLELPSRIRRLPEDVPAGAVGAALGALSPAPAAGALSPTPAAAGGEV
jgi:predicted NBD/HSP70 family sugar kinase